jgi:hypothetical protein
MLPNRTEKRKGPPNALTADAERSRRSRTEQAMLPCRPIAGPAARLATAEISVVFLFLTVRKAAAASATCRQWYRALLVGQPANWTAAVPYAQWTHAAKSPFRRHIHTLRLEWHKIPTQDVWKPFYSSFLVGFTALRTLHVQLANADGFPHSTAEEMHLLSPPAKLTDLKIELFQNENRDVDINCVKYALPTMAPRTLTSLEFVMRNRAIFLDLDGLQAYQQLTCLSLNAVTNTARMFSVIRQLASLEKLHIKYLLDIELTELCTEPHALQRLHTLSTHFYALDPSRIEQLARLPALTHLEGRWPCYSAGVPFLHRLSQITSIVLHGHRLTPMFLRDSANTNLSHITHMVLEATECSFPLEVIPCLLQTFLQNNPQLLSLEFCSCQMPDLTLLSHPHLQRLYIHASCAGPNPVDLTTQFPKLIEPASIRTTRCHHCS